MTSCAADWLTRTFRCLFDDSNRGSRVRGLRFTPPRLEALESRNLLSNASGVWSFVSAPPLHPMKVNVLTLHPGASLNPIFVAPYDQSSNPSLLVGQTGPLIMDASGNPIWFHPRSSNNRVQVIDFRSSDLVRQAGVDLVAGNDRGDRTEQVAPWHVAGGALRHLQPELSRDHVGPITERSRVGLARTLDHAARRRLFHHDETRQGESDPLRRSGKRGVYRPGNRRSQSADREADLHLEHGRARPLERFDCPGSHDSGSAVGPLPCQFDRRESRRLATPGFRANTWGIYDISRTTGQILWQIGGKQNQFSLPSDLITGPYGSAFQYQHDARVRAGRDQPLRRRRHWRAA